MTEISCLKRISIPEEDVWPYAILWLIREYRLKETDVARIAGCHVRTVRNWRARVCEPHWPHVARLVAFGGSPFRDLIMPDCHEGSVIYLQTEKKRKAQ